MVQIFAVTFYLSKIRNIEFVRESVFVPYIQRWNCGGSKVVGIIVITTPGDQSEQPGSGKLRDIWRPSGTSDPQNDAADVDGSMVDVYIKWVRLLMSNFTSFFDAAYLEMFMKKEKKWRLHVTKLVNKMMDEVSIHKIMQTFRLMLPKIFGFEEAAILVRAIHPKAIGGETKEVGSENKFFALSPNSSCKELARDDAFLDLYYYTESYSISANAFNNSEFLHVYEPRLYPNWHEGIDNLTPLAQIKDAVYCSLGDKKQNTVGV
jgi:hypothetical protein